MPVAKHRPADLEENAHALPEFDVGGGDYDGQEQQDLEKVRHRPSASLPSPRQQPGEHDLRNDRGNRRAELEPQAARQDARTEKELPVHVAHHFPRHFHDMTTNINKNIADRTSAMVEESGRALALMEARRERIDRLQAENRRMLDALVAGNAL